MRKGESAVGPDQFEKVQTEICASGPPSSGDNLLGMEIDSVLYLGDQNNDNGQRRPWSGMTVRQTPTTGWLITGHATGRRVDVTAIAAELSRTWEQHLRYDFRSAHALVSTPTAVVLHAVTQIAPGDIWVTAEVRVDLD